MSAKGIIKNTFTVGAFTALSRVLGLVREMLQSRLIGAGMEQSAFTLAFAIPNMARKLFGEGALTAAFVPVFKNEVETESLESAAKLARAVMTMVVMMLSATVFLGLAGIDAVSRWRVLSGMADAERFGLTVGLVKTLLPYMIFICAAAFGMGVLNALGRFKASSSMPCLLNVCWIATLACLSLRPGLSAAERIRYIAVAILAAGVLQTAFMFWRMSKAGVSPLPSFSGWGSPKVRLVWRNIAIGAVGAGAIQINYMLDQFLAQVASPWAAGVIGYAERLMDLPLGVIGAAFGTVLLPTFAGYFAKKDLDGACKAMSSSVNSLMFVMIPAAAGLFVLAPEITSVIYEGKAFDAQATMRVSRAVAVYALGLGFFGLQKSLVPWFHAQGDMKTPLKVSVWTVFLNAALNIAAVVLLPVEWRHAGLAASTVACAGIGCAILAFLATGKNGRTGLASCAAPVAKTLAASVVMALAVSWLKSFTGACGRIPSLCILVCAGCVSYLAFAAAMMPDALAKVFKRGKKK